MLKNIQGELDHGDRSVDLADPEKALEDLALIQVGLDHFKEVLEEAIDEDLDEIRTVR